MESCNKPAASFIPRRGEYFACVLDKGHDGECRPGGNCFKHGPYSSEPSLPPQCPHWPSCINELPEVDRPETDGFVLLPLNGAERKALDELSKANEMSEEAVLHQALRVYQLTDSFFKKGYELAFWHPTEGFVHPFNSGPKKASKSDDDSGGWGWSGE